ncbi:MAG TPA: hypothetical protein VGL25_12445 [Casimicrobiaceae bacterium]|jgi:hypothetical protein
MTSINRWGCCALASFFLVGASWADNDGPQSCAAKAAGLYGFQCHGSSFTGAKLEPVTFVGTVVGDASGVYEGFGTFNSSLGSVSTHVVGTASFGKNCFGHIDYTTNEIVLPGGGTVPLPPVSFDFISVDNNRETLGTGVAPAGVTGDFVPRLTCRLVRIGH